MMVAVSVFSMVMLVAVGALLTVMDANRKAHALQSVINNLNFAVESISRTARVGTTYYCYDRDPLEYLGNSIESPRDCSRGGQLIAFEAHDGDPADLNDQVVYRLNGTRLERSLDGGGTFVSITSSKVRINELTFYVLGSSLRDSDQPRIFMTIRGVAGVSARSETKFDLQTTITQRVPDVP